MLFGVELKPGLEFAHTFVQDTKLTAATLAVKKASAAPKDTVYLKVRVHGHAPRGCAVARAGHSCAVWRKSCAEIALDARWARQCPKNGARWTMGARATAAVRARGDIFRGKPGDANTSGAVLCFPRKPQVQVEDGWLPVAALRYGSEEVRERLALVRADFRSPFPPVPLFC